ncbi:hypothetical protein RvY_10788 [Ramazzottius varieornatus]|uniref:Uncharacterized protein n=1 Tax=Ramazzottius varieornatus TaxID=947166 RepID=A0A1D1VMX1_RAMVA|nr:hypothetical protein RvY_10788 [Ramazzottius varieornatus]
MVLLETRKRDRNSGSSGLCTVAQIWQDPEPTFDQSHIWDNANSFATICEVVDWPLANPTTGDERTSRPQILLGPPEDSDRF